MSETAKVPSILNIAAVQERGFQAGQAAARSVFMSETETAIRPTGTAPANLPSFERVQSVGAMEALLKAGPLLEGLSRQERKRVIRDLIRDHRREAAVLRKEYDDKTSKLERMDRLKGVYEDLIEWASQEGAWKLERADQSQFREFRKEILQGRGIHIASELDNSAAALDYDKEILRHAEVFVVQHDWAAAFANAGDVENAPFRLPYDSCAFEFQLGGRRFIALAAESEGRVSFTAAAHTGSGWFMPGFLYWDGAWHTERAAPDMDDGFTVLLKKIGDQVRCICIALDAKVAIAQVTREPHEGTHGKNTYSLTKPYHIVSLARRERAAALPTIGGTGRKKRLHFRRGHWRHFEKSKTWISWMLVGDPELGFIDKEYRL